MGAELLVIHIAVLSGALAQTATGVGFGVIAGPFILMALNDSSAIQVSILLSLLVSVVLTPSLIKSVDRALLPRLVFGTAIGLPFGVWVLAAATVDVLRLLAGLVVLLMALLASGVLSRSSGPARRSGGLVEDVGAGLVSGVMSASLAMPGPVVAASMVTRGQSKAGTRATLMTLFVFSYTVGIIIQAATMGVAASTLRLCLTLVPATLLGVLIGKTLAGRVSERLFRWAIALLLAATAVSLLFEPAVAALSLG